MGCTLFFESQGINKSIIETSLPINFISIWSAKQKTAKYFLFVCFGFRTSRNSRNLFINKLCFNVWEEMCYWVTTIGGNSPLHGEKSAGNMLIFWCIQKNRILTLPIAKTMRVLMFLLACNLILVILHYFRCTTWLFYILYLTMWSLTNSGNHKLPCKLNKYYWLYSPSSFHLPPFTFSLLVSIPFGLCFYKPCSLIFQKREWGFLV